MILLRSEAIDLGQKSQCAQPLVNEVNIVCFSSMDSRPFVGCIVRIYCVNASFALVPGLVGCLEDDMRD